MKRYEIPFGPDYRTQLDKLLGSNPRNINNAIYEQPSRAAYALSDGRYAILTTTTYGYTTRVTILPDHDAYVRTWYATLYDVRDPE
jgi:hypothetical protein